MKYKSLRVLIVEDSEDNALLFIHDLRQGGYKPVYERVETAAALKKALQEKPWDIILCGDNLPGFKAPSVIALSKKANIAIPLIVISGTNSNETVVECMRLGAQDYIMKDNLTRLCPAIARELKEAEGINRQKQMESPEAMALESLRESEERYKALFCRSLDMVYLIDFNGRFIDANDAALNRLGYTREELSSLNFASLVCEDQLPLALEIIREIKETGIQKDLAELRLRHKDGSCVYVESQGSAVMSHGIPVAIQGIARDITARKKTEESLYQSEGKYRTILENSQEAYYEVDLAGNLIFFNEATWLFFGYSKAELIGTNFRNYTDEENYQKVFQAFNEVNKTGESISGIEWQIIKKDGTRKYVEQSASLMKDPAGKSIGFRGIIHNITERRRMEEKLQQTLHSLRKAVGATIQVMVSAVEVRDPYTAGHQVRTSDLARAIATEMGLSGETIDGIRMAGSIHDIGKLSIPSEILAKPTKLSHLEFSLIKEHARQGFEMLKNVESPWPLAQIVYQHHERINGSGYPRNLKADEILMEARIMAVADVVEAMASHRPYRPGLGIEAALDEIDKNKGIFYDLAVADACLTLFRQKGYKLP